MKKQEFEWRSNGSKDLLHRLERWRWYKRLKVAHLMPKFLTGSLKTKKERRHCPIPTKGKFLLLYKLLKLWAFLRLDFIIFEWKTDRANFEEVNEILLAFGRQFISMVMHLSDPKIQPGFDNHLRVVTINSSIIQLIHNKLLSLKNPLCYKSSYARTKLQIPESFSVI